MAYRFSTSIGVNLVRYYPQKVDQDLHMLFFSEGFIHVQMELKSYDKVIWSSRSLLLRPGKQELILNLNFLPFGAYWIEWNNPGLPWIEFLKA
jgi:hypothetical protein